MAGVDRGGRGVRDTPAPVVAEARARDGSASMAYGRYTPSPRWNLLVSRSRRNPEEKILARAGVGRLRHARVDGAALVLKMGLVSA